MFVLDAIKEYSKTERPAWRGREECLSFKELDDRSEAFAAWLYARFGYDLAPVVIYGHKEAGLLPCIFGALKSGRAYVPVDDILPPARAEEIAADVKPRAVVNLSGLALDIPGADILDSSALANVLRAGSEPEIPRDRWVAGDDIAYILFTSGSTGRPKGVPITAANLKAFNDGVAPYYLNAGNIILDQVSYSFDVSCCSVYAGLSRGMTLLAAEKELLADMGALYARLGASGLDMWVSTPSFAELCVRSRTFNAELLPKLRTFLFCGEVLTHKLCDELAERFPQALILNTYGPTEATVLVTAARVTRETRMDLTPIPIGEPLRGVELRLDGCDENEEGPGELLILGDCVGPGYLNREELTAERFFADEKNGKRGYRTGDICTRRGNMYYYRGRVDNQIKIAGYRVELEDVETNLMKLDNVLSAAVVPVWEHDKVRELAAFVLLKEDDGLTSLKRTVALKKQAARLLPGYMLPRRIIALESFPLNTNGKTDRKALALMLKDGAAT